MKKFQKVALIDEILRRPAQAGVKIMNLTFDGLKSNFTACRLFGASFASDNLAPFFLNPMELTRWNKSPYYARYAQAGPKNFRHGKNIV